MWCYEVCACVWVGGVWGGVEGRKGRVVMKGVGADLARLSTASCAAGPVNVTLDRRGKVDIDDGAHVLRGHRGFVRGVRRGRTRGRGRAGGGGYGVV